MKRLILLTVFLLPALGVVGEAERAAAASSDGTSIIPTTWFVDESGDGSQGRESVFQILFPGGPVGAQSAVNGCSLLWTGRIDNARLSHYTDLATVYFIPLGGYTADDVIASIKPGTRLVKRSTGCLSGTWRVWYVDVYVPGDR